MRRFRPLWLISLPLLLSLACNAITGAGAAQVPTSTPAPADTLPPAATEVAAPTDADTPLPADTPVPPAATDTPEAVTGAHADTPTPADDTGSFPTPTAPAAAGADQATQVAAANATMAAALAELTTAMPVLGGTLAVSILTPGMEATQQAQMGSMGNIQSIAQYYNPVGTPATSWHDVPIMSQAYAGQEYGPNVYSYRANATLAQASAYYAAKAASLGGKQPLMMGTGHAGTGSNATHSASLASFALTIIITSLDNDPQHVIVTISTAP